jgi:hypothetical protein
LWESLITRSLSNPAFLSDLLEHVGSHYVDLSALILRIPGNLAIPKLKQKLITILSDCELQQSVIKGCTTIMANDCVALAARLHRRRKRAIKVPLGTRCCICEVEVLSSSGGGISGGQGQGGSRSGGGGAPASSSIVVFFCRHAMHRSCADAQRSVSERRTEFACPKCDVHAHGHTTAVQQQQQQSPSSNNAKSSSTPTAAASPSSVTAKSPRVGAIAIGTPSTHGRGLPSVGMSPLPTARSVLPIPGAAASASTVSPFAATPSSSSSMFPSPAVAAATATGPTSGSVSSSAHTRNLSSTPTAAAFASSSSSSAATALHAPHSARSATPSTGGSGAFFAAQQQVLQQQQQPTPASLLHSASPANAPRGSLSARQPPPSVRKH